MNKLSFLQTSATFLMAALLGTACTTNWPQYRGPDQNLVVTQANLPSEWGDDENIRWSTGIDGDSWSSPVVWGNKIFVTAAVPVKVNPPAQQQGAPQGGQEEDQSWRNDIYRWEVACYDAGTGEELWKVVAREGNPRAKKHRATTYASESPVVDGQRLYVYFGNIGMFCYDHEGQLLWERDLGAFETLNGWGTGSSPVLHDGLLYQQVDNEEYSFLVALDAASGNEVWRVNREEKTNYSTPVIWKNSKRTELVTGGKRARSYDPETGELLWELQIDGFYNIPSPVPGEEMIYLGGAGFQDTPGTLFAVKAGASGDITPAEGEISNDFVAWSNPDAPTMNPTPLLYNGLLYVLSSRGGTLTCFDAGTGEQIYQEKAEGMGACWASPWAHGDHIYFYDETGKTSVIRAGREYELLHQNSLEGKFWASVAVAGDAYIFKAVEKLYCIGL
ncbi:MAG: outer membrane protein assembly factor BamB family protein [Bacteroidales bacterium]